MKNYSTVEKIKLLFTYTSYLIFLCFIGYLIISEKNYVTYLFIVFAIFALVASVYYETLKVKYHKALYALNFELNSDKALDLYEDLLKKDYLRGYQKTKILFYLQYYTEKQDAHKMLEILNENQKELRKGLYMLSILYYYQLRACFINQDVDSITEVYNKILELRKTRKNPKLFNPLEIDGMYYLVINHRKKAYTCFKNINMKNMNPKERKFIFENLIVLAKDEKEKKEYQKQII